MVQVTLILLPLWTSLNSKYLRLGFGGTWIVAVVLHWTGCHHTPTENGTKYLRVQMSLMDNINPPRPNQSRSALYSIKHPAFRILRSAFFLVVCFYSFSLHLLFLINIQYNPCGWKRFEDLSKVAIFSCCCCSYSTNTLTPVSRNV